MCVFGDWVEGWIKPQPRNPRTEQTKEEGHILKFAIAMMREGSTWILSSPEELHSEALFVVLDRCLQVAHSQHHLRVASSNHFHSCLSASFSGTLLCCTPSAVNQKVHSYSLPTSRMPAASISQQKTLCRTNTPNKKCSQS